ncbi:RHS repeat-associated core domain-containing protein [Bordetella bronchialis]|uniref:RHS repeat-associated core domain-containing protein n=1 Tax=Bordetella bronchialis TaxID=463025 RepID=A0A193G3F2_9BORD|nr:RHS repeat-associated core domain-containing protein [Bordetella bronchialis]ANN68601.1 hypothetical protein BAU06_21855 [Bordetella bronchialis]ANN73739.1 hypothetical protein BAU08_22385 [Bordetella bronchialis]
MDGVTGGYALGNGYRMFLPALMRFNAPDTDSPFGLGGVNGYAYCADDPINGSDPSGHMMLGAGMLRDAQDALEQTIARAADPSRFLDADGVEAVLAAPSGQRRNSADEVADFFGDLDNPGHAAAPVAGPSAPTEVPLAPGHAAAAGLRPAHAAAPGAVEGVVGQTVRLRRLPANYADLDEFVRALHDAGSIDINPDRRAISRKVYSITPQIVLNGVALGRNDPVVVNLMKRLGATRGRGGSLIAPYVVKLKDPTDNATALDVAFRGTVPGAPDFSVVVVPLGRSYTVPVFVQAFFDQAKTMGKRVRWNVVKHRNEFY